MDESTLQWIFFSCASIIPRELTVRGARPVTTEMQPSRLPSTALPALARMFIHENLLYCWTIGEVPIDFFPAFEYSFFSLQWIIWLLPRQSGTSLVQKLPCWTIWKTLQWVSNHRPSCLPWLPCIVPNPSPSFRCAPGYTRNTQAGRQCVPIGRVGDDRIQFVERPEGEKRRRRIRVRSRFHKA